MAAPRRTASGQPGSRLDWEQFQEAIWQVYHPYRALRVRAYPGDARIALEECPPLASRRTAAGTHRCLKAVRWESAAQTAVEQIDLLRLTPTLKRYLAACIPPRQRSVRIADLPNEDSFEFLHLAGGFAVVSAQGAYLVDDWRREPLPLAEIADEFDSACTRLDEVAAAGDEVNALQDAIDRFLQGRRAAPGRTGQTHHRHSPAARPRRDPNPAAQP